MRLKILAVGAALAVCVGAPAQLAGQSLAERVVVRSYVGAFMPQEASALQTAPLVGLRVGYELIPAAELALNVSMTRGLTRANFFAPAVLTFSERSELWDVQQEVSTLSYGLEAGFGMDAGSFRPYVALGGGGYTQFLSAETNQAIRRVRGGLLTGALGAGIQVAERSALSLELRNNWMLGYKPEALNPVELAHRDQLWVEHNPRPAADKDRVSALSLSLGFTFRP
jgi:hypothetical protein